MYKRSSPAPTPLTRPLVITRKPEPQSTSEGLIHHLFFTRRNRKPHDRTDLLQRKHNQSLRKQNSQLNTTPESTILSHAKTLILGITRKPFQWIRLSIIFVSKAAQDSCYIYYIFHAAWLNMLTLALSDRTLPSKFNNL